jgi:hypothetical protein
MSPGKANTRQEAYNQRMQPRFFVTSGGPNLWLILWMIVIGLAALAAGAVWGLAQVTEWLFPYIRPAAVLGLGAYLAGILPLSIVRGWRPHLVGPALFIAQMYGLGLWMVSFLLLWKWVGFFALPAVLIAPLAAPLAALGSLLKNHWEQAASLLLAMIMVRAMRSYAAWLAPVRAGRRPADQSDVIETVVVETREENSGPPKRISNDGGIQ